MASSSNLKWLITRYLLPKSWSLLHCLRSSIFKEFQVKLEIMWAIHVPWISRHHDSILRSHAGKSKLLSTRSFRSWLFHSLLLIQHQLLKFGEPWLHHLRATWMREVYLKVLSLSFLIFKTWTIIIPALQHWKDEGKCIHHFHQMAWIIE